MSDKESIDSGAGWPRLALFVIPLPDPFPVPDGEVYTRSFEEEIEGFADIDVFLSPGVPFPEADRGRQLVAVQFRQVPFEAELDLMGMEAAAQVFSQVTGQSQQEDVADRLRGVESYRTVAVVTAWAGEPPEEAATRSDAPPDVFTRCVDLLQFLSRGYRVSEGARVPELTYERLPPSVLMSWKDPTTGEFFGGGLLMLTHFNLRGAPGPEILDDERLARLRVYLDRLRAGDPLVLFSERMLNARIALWQTGDYGDAAVQAALACEVLLDAVLGLMLWEEQLVAPDEQIAAAIFGVPLKSRVRREYHPRLGGDWSLTDGGSVATWDEQVARLRGRVVHRGYRPTQDEAYAAVEEASGALLDFVKGRLAERVRTYPRTSLLLLGEPGLRRLGAWNAIERFAQEVADTEPLWLLSYRDWRNRVDALL
ncbi:MAG: hypothetical protein M3O70_25865 [Actinomycetota bacterium]|nr:hypothetical protein [Actinomycetota bacterium]